MTAIWGNNTLADGTVQTQKIGDANPTFRMGFSNDFTFGPFRVSSMLDWQRGSDVINLTKLLADLSSNSEDCNVILEGGESACERRVRLWPTQTSVYVEDASFIKLRELSVSYDVPQHLVNRFLPGGGRFARVSLSGRNLIRITDYTGMDPEVSNFGSQAIGRNVDVAPFPPSRSFWFSFELGF